jgi:hypothetical protein
MDEVNGRGNCKNGQQREASVKQQQLLHYEAQDRGKIDRSLCNVSAALGILQSSQSQPKAEQRNSYVLIVAVFMAS